MSRIDKLNKTILKETADLINREIENNDCLITLTYAKFSSDLTQIKIGFSVLPENRVGDILKKIQKSSTFIAKTLKNKYNLRVVPFLKWEVDFSHSKFFEIEELLEKK